MSHRIRYVLAIALLTGIASFHSRAEAGEKHLDGPWRYTLQKPMGNWRAADFDDAEWREGAGGFGTRSTPGVRVGTDWRTNDIWLRRTVEFDTLPAKPALLIHHDEDAEVFVNGTPVGAFEGYTSEYKVVPIGADAAKSLKKGENVLAVHCRQTRGGQFIDVHVVDANDVPELPPAKPPTEPFLSELITEWGAEVTPENAWREYPRPQMARENWTNLNGPWNYAITPAEQVERPETWAGEILVPFCLESKLGGVQRLLDPSEALWYRRTFSVEPRADRRVRLNFEAVDYACTVWVNGTEVGEHVGGNVPFEFDVTDALKAGENEFVLRVLDETGGFQLTGKQRLDPHAIWYTRVSGIWQTVWLEEVPTRSIADLVLATDVEQGTITVRPELRGEATEGETLRVVARDGKEIVGVATITGITGDADELELEIPNAKLWSPSSPHLYDLEVAVLDAEGEVLDSVSSYAGIRSVGKTRDADGHLRFTLNGERVFHWGPLDQGWWPDGLLTPPSDAALKFDVEFLKAAGFNMIRKHIKVEPRRFYMHCDRLGMMVWQDQVSGGTNPPWTRMAPNPVDAQWSDADHEQYLREFEAMVDALENHPSIVVWVPYNEAWGQHRTLETGKWIAARDPSRLVNIASGGNFWPGGDIADEHRYPHPGFPFDPERYGDFVMVVGEFGGHGLPIEGHLWDADRDNWGYGGLPKNAKEYEERYRESIRLLAELREQGIAGGVYTQTTDVEGEINGLMSYDRKVIKLPAEKLAEIHRALGVRGDKTK